MRVKWKTKESGEPVFIRNSKQQGGTGGNYKTLGWLKYSNLAIQLGMRQGTFIGPFIVRVLSQRKPIKNTVLLNRTCT